MEPISFTAVAALSKTRKGEVLPWVIGWPSQGVLKAVQYHEKAERGSNCTFALGTDGVWYDADIVKSDDGKLLQIRQGEPVSDETVSAWLSKQSRHW